MSMFSGYYRGNGAGFYLLRMRSTIGVTFTFTLQSSTLPFTFYLYLYLYKALPYVLPYLTLPYLYLTFFIHLKSLYACAIVVDMGPEKSEIKLDFEISYIRFRAPCRTPRLCQTYVRDVEKLINRQNIQKEENTLRKLFRRAGEAKGLSIIL